MPRALFLSPHLDDVAFSCAVALHGRLRAGWNVDFVTVFTRSVASPTGFALACQTDKGLAPELDYMQLRRAEDEEFGRIFGVSPTHWPLEEAPHRGYESAPALFGEAREDDDIWRPIAEALRVLPAPDEVYAPQGLGNHIDHRQVIRAVNEAGFAPRTRWYRDTPYAIREPEARASSLLPSGLGEDFVAFDEDELIPKVRGCCAYASQIGFQFGGASQVARKLRDFHQSEARLAGCDGFAERFLRFAGD